MKENMKQMQCGSCGFTKVRIYTDLKEELIVECASCKNQSAITVPTPKIAFTWVDGNDGLHTVF